MSEHQSSVTPPAQPVSDRIDTTRPHSARFWNYFVGGKDNYEVDREIGDQIKTFFPGLVDVAVAGRQFLRRSVSHLVEERGYGSSWTSGQVCPPRTTPTRWPRTSRPSRASCMWTTTRSC